MSMNGAESLVQTLLACGVDTCFANPGTSEMHFVAALDRVPGMHCVLALFEGVATGAADGYARMAETTGVTLLHLGPGLGNGLANLHNARRARVAILNIVGDHAIDHVRYDAPLQSDIETVARNVSTWVRTATATATLGADAAEAIAAAGGPPGQVATLIVPADVSWSDGGEPAGPAAISPRAAVPDEAVERAAAALRGPGRAGILLGGTALRARGLRAAARIAAATGARLYCEVFPARLERGTGLPRLERLAYFPEPATAQLDGLEHLVLVDTKVPASFFAYPGRRSTLAPEACRMHELAAPAADAIEGLEALADLLGAARAQPAPAPVTEPARPTGALTAEKASAAIALVLPEGAIVSDEALTSGMTLPTATAGAPRHDWLTLTGGAIGQGLPLAVGAAVACPDRPVLALQADGSSLYTIQSLWTMAREQLDVTVVLFNNRSYAILNVELARVGARAAGPRARAQFDLCSPDLDFVALGTGFGVPSRRASTAEELIDALRQAIVEPGPHLIEALVPAGGT
jgi:acetolactate synthase-1/2/3 large subunit